jgi:hypothetical protein
MVEEALIPCTTMQPEIAHAMLTERHPGDLLRVTGHLTLPHTADGITLKRSATPPMSNPDQRRPPRTAHRVDDLPERFP